MADFPSAHPAPSPDAVAPDGSEVRLLTALKGGSFAHFTLGPGEISRAVRHKNVEEIWYFVSGEGALWRQEGEQEKIEPVRPGLTVAIPAGMAFQFRAAWDAPLVFVAVTMPPWPGEQEAETVEGMWAV
jgi:mannose-6-phosphate isomerase-like protein (cupin superfamily)